MTVQLALDHIVIAVADLDSAVAGYRELGFTVLPGGEHPRGSRNALIVFDDASYIEIIAFGRPVPGFRWYDVLQRAGPGLVDVALFPPDLDVAVAAANRRGLDYPPPQDGSRLQPDGQRLAWRSARTLVNDVPFLCTDVTDRAFRVPEGAPRRHANGITGVASVAMAVTDFERSMARWRALLGELAEPVPLPGLPCRGAGFSIGRLGFVLLAPEGNAFPALSAHLDRRGIGPFAVAFRGPRPCRLDPDLAQGVALEVVAG